MIRIVRDLMLLGACVLSTLGPAPAQTVPKFEVDPSWPKTLPNNWIIGTIGGITVDAQDHIWINQRPSGLDAREKRASTAPNVKCCVPAPPVIEFDQAGKVVQGWGGDGPDYKWGNDGHGIHVDHNNFVWVGDNIETGGHIYKFTRDGKFVMRIGKPGTPAADRATPSISAAPPKWWSIARPTSCSSPTATATSVSIVFDAATGAYKRHWGAYGKPPERREASLGLRGLPHRRRRSSPTRCTASPSPSTGWSRCATASTTACSSSARTGPSCARSLC